MKTFFRVVFSVALVVAVYVGFAFDNNSGIAYAATTCQTVGNITTCTSTPSTPPTPAPGGSVTCQTVGNVTFCN